MTRVLTTESWSALQNPLLSSRLIIMRSSLRRGNSTGLNKFSKPHPTTSIPRNSSDLHEFRMSIYSAVVHPWWQRQSFSKIGQSKDSLRFGKIPSHRCWLTPSIAHSPNWPTKCQDTVRPWPIYDTWVNLQVLQKRASDGLNRQHKGDEFDNWCSKRKPRQPVSNRRQEWWNQGGVSKIAPWYNFVTVAETLEDNI